ncbi:hypothetical protein DFH07DRAFT_819116 [Mycena maculata]|uniref:F-box domain-containing protein n=1 Tax=Mycena maculata TaxID=230809 RepID=A0AAD7J5N6_9AGAR|nr:hypothetical protein DFH07DRAFT_819116 [Mycena maculata]
MESDEASQGITASDATGDLPYPVESRIPTDILELIFEAGALHAQRQISTVPKTIEIVVSHVNKRWREVAVNLAALWSFIRASPFEGLDKLETYFERSKGHGLRVCLFAYRAYWAPDIVERMRPHMHRIRRFHLVTDFIQSSPTICSHFMHFDMPSLECFLYTPLDVNNFNEPPGPSLLPFTQELPLLSSIRLNGPTLHLIRPPFSRVSQLCLTEERFPIPFRSICEILHSCGSLVKFAFSGHTQRPHRRLATSLDIVPFTLPELRYLILSNGGNSDVILSAMTAPKLCALRLNYFEEDDLGHFLQLSQISKFPVLESLYFLDNAFSINEYHDIARIFPAIRTLSCINSSYTDELLEFLVPLLTSGSVTHMPWPNLGTLLFNQAQFQEKHQQMLCTLVSARVVLRAPILNLFLGLANRLLLDTERLDWLRERLRVDERWEMLEDEELRLLGAFAGDANIC